MGWRKLGIEAQKRIRPLSLSELCDSSEQYLCLKHQKAAGIRTFAPVGESRAKEHKIRGNRASQHRLAVASQITGLHQLVDSKWQNWLKRHLFYQRSGKMVHHYSWLAADAMASGKHLWSLAQKSHLILHFASHTTIHPSLAWTLAAWCKWLLRAHMGHQVTKCQKKFVKIWIGVFTCT